MWGNTQGWIISAALAILMGFLLYRATKIPPPTPPTNAPELAIAHRMMVFPVAPSAVVPPGTSEFDAGDAYRDAIKLYESDSHTYEAYLVSPKGMTRDQLPGVERVVDARRCRVCHLFDTDPAALIDYSVTAHPQLEALDHVGLACSTLALLEKQSNNEDAQKLAEAEFTLGAHLAEERVTWEEFTTGYKLMQNAATTLVRVYDEQKDKGGAKRDKAEQFMTQTGDQSKLWVEAEKLIGSISDDASGDYAGDFFSIAADPMADPMFRVGAMLHVGRYRFRFASQGDRIAAEAFIAKMQSEATLPPTVKVAVKVAADQTADTAR